MALDRRIMTIGIILMVFAAMMPFSAIVILSFSGAETLVLGIQQIFFYLGWFINPLIMIITGIVIMRVSRSSEFSRAVLAGIIMALTYTVLIVLIQVGFTPEGPLFLPFSGIELSEGYMGSFLDMALKAWVFCIAGCLFGAYSVYRQAREPEKSFSGT